MKNWFMNLSRAGKVGLVGAALLGILITGTATQDTKQPAKATCSATEKITETVTPVAFEKTQVEDVNMEKGKTTVRTAGANGEKTTTSKVITYAPTGCKASTTTLVKEEITKPAVNEVTAVGTKALAPAPAPAPSYASPSSSRSCHPSYSPCVPNVGYDLDCPDIGMRVSVVGVDSYRLDADHDGIGCESY